MGLYDTYVLPHILDLACSQKAVQQRRRLVVPHARGRVLEIGMGSGHNLPFYDPQKVELVWGLEPAEPMRRLAEPRVRRVPFEVRFLDLPGEQIPLDDAAADTVLTTFTLCTIPDVATALAGMRRVLKPGGTLLFLEHGAAPDARVQRWQRRLEPGWKRAFGGCHITRPIPRLLEDAGFALRDCATGYMEGWDAAWLPAGFKVAAFEYWGTAARA
jgi:ubiquinone/menaquinone biosynthesis C-methylase UbiE